MNRADALGALQLLGFIVAALLLQLALGTAVVLRRRRHAAPQPPLPVPERGSEASAGAWPGWREFRVLRRTFEDAANSQCSFQLQPLDGLPLRAFLPGQYLTFALPLGTGGGDVSAASSIIRCYSLSDRPDPAAYRITVKRVPAPLGRADLPSGLSSTWLLDHVNVGEVLRIKAPAGRFFIDADASVPTVLVAGGIGITPMISMLRWCAAERPTRTVHLYYGVRNCAEHAFKPLLEQLAAERSCFHLNVVYSQPGVGDRAGQDFQHAGRVDVALLQRTLPHGRHQFYVCGPPAMMDSLVPALLQWGVPKADVHFEAFGPASPRLAVPTPGAVPPARLPLLDVSFNRSDRTIAWDGQDANLLDFADRHGVAIDSGCRSGSCGTCETRIVSGAVRYEHAPDHDVAPGHCLPCVGRPASALVLAA